MRKKVWLAVLALSLMMLPVAVCAEDVALEDG